MIERRKDLLTRLIVDDMIDDLRAGDSALINAVAKVQFFADGPRCEFGCA